MDDPVVDGADGLTAAWLTAALNESGHELVVESVATERIGTGQIGATFRLRLSYAGAAGPPTLVAKVAAGDEAARGAVAHGYAAEAGFYKDIAGSVDVRTPTCWYGAITDDHTRFTLLLDDISDASPGVQADGCTLDQARAAIANLVGLHAPRWADPALYKYRFLMRPDAAVAETLGFALGAVMDGFLERYAADLGNEVSATLRAVAPVIAAWQTSRIEPFAVIHGDYRLDNLMFSTTGSDVVAVDWQTAAIGPPLRDVAYFLGTSLEPDQRRAHEQALVAEYHSAVVARGITGYDAEQCWDDYRLGLLQGPMVTVLGCMYASGVRSEASDRMFRAMAHRSCTAIADLSSIDLVERES